MLCSQFNCSILDSTTGSSLVRIKEFASFWLFQKNTQNWKTSCRANTSYGYMYVFSYQKISTLFKGHKVHTPRMYVPHVCMVCGCCQEMDPFLPKPMGCESLSASYHSGCITSPKNISCGEHARVCVCLCMHMCVVDH